MSKNIVDEKDFTVTYFEDKDRPMVQLSFRGIDQLWAFQVMPYTDFVNLLAIIRRAMINVNEKSE